MDRNSLPPPTQSNVYPLMSQLATIVVIAVATTITTIVIVSTATTQPHPADPPDRTASIRASAGRR
jgi:hypothetical protein